MTQPPPSGQPGGYYRSQYSQPPSDPPQHPEPGAQYPPPPSAAQPYPPPVQPAYGDQAHYGTQTHYGTPPPPGSPPSYGNPPGYGGPPSYGSPPPGYQPGPVTGPGATPPPPGSGKGRLLGIFGGIGGAVLLGIGVLVVRAVLGNATNEVQLNIQVPDVGECITQESTFGTETEVVACDSTEAAWRVIGNAGSLTESGFAATAAEEVCAAFPDTEYALWIGEVTTDQSGDGEVVCMVQVVAGS